MVRSSLADGTADAGQRRAKSKCQGWHPRSCLGLAFDAASPGDLEGVETLGPFAGVPDSGELPKRTAGLRRCAGRHMLEQLARLHGGGVLGAASGGP